MLDIYLNLLLEYNKFVVLFKDCGTVGQRCFQSITKIYIQIGTFIYLLQQRLLCAFYKSERTPKPGPGGSELREVNSPIGSAANLPFLKPNKILTV